jgi:asparagine synthase (glutamine-hydrolysing)
MPEDLAHAWLDAPAATAALPGKAGHIAALLRAQQTLEPGRSRHAPVLNPLLSQPLVEACLAIPSWEWRAGGIDRAVARHAFARDLPDSILRRRVKGGPDGFCAEIIRHHRPRIRVRLLDGRLANHRLIDREAVDVLLGGARPIPGEMQVRILDLLDTEAWLDSWSARLAAITPPVAPGAATPPNA